MTGKDTAMDNEALRKVRLSDLLDTALLDAAIEAGNVRVQTHPDDEGWRIYNYTEQAQWSRSWDGVTTQCRGLIVRDGEVIARPWRKFFNYGEHDEGSLDLTAPVQVTDKIDGSLGILYTAPDGRPAIATRGSFTSDQALHATELYRRRYDDDWGRDHGLTYLFEIVYPQNRIVLDYGLEDDLFLLGAVETATGRTFGPDETTWRAHTTKTFIHRTLADALTIEPRPNAEGVVVRYTDGTMVKIKQDDYVALHKIITGLNARVVWEEIGNGRTVQDLCEPLPDEFHGWVKQIAEGLRIEAAAIHDAATAEHDRIIADLPDGWTRKDFAIQAARSPLKSWLFILLDGNDPTSKIWRSLKPSGAVALVRQTEDAA